MKKNKRYYKKKKRNYIGTFFIMFMAAVALLVVVSGLFVFGQVISNENRYTSEEVQPSLDRQSFIETVAPISQKVSQQYGVLPSIIIGQAILESNFGQSQLAAEYNNLFGIKADKHEKRVLLPTKEFEENNWHDKEAYFKVYDNYESAIVDHSQLFVKGVSWDANLYQGVLAAQNYTEAAQALQQAGYATDPNYANKIIEVIESYNLSVYDS